MFSDSNEIKTQSEFMYELKDLVKQCEFTNSNELVKFLFLIHNKQTEVTQELLKHITKETALAWCLEYACNIEGNLQLVELLKYVDKVQPDVSTTEAYVHVVDKKRIKPR